MTNEPTHCPHCGNVNLYRLADGRCKCSACKRKFSSGARRTRITADAMEEIVAGFAAGASASAVAADADLNVKTVQKLHQKIQ